ncbi:pilus assembly protein PilP [Marinobacterium aestuarii]|uniref:Pilus assembly protein PilP n=1 Tax=Marinobacterium aestuarii TaxID=1821621 RepID=A0A1A9F4R5_9GAMM|nr:pilus assembly protein PilP [Marinobacterium aestuarii]
MFLLATLASGCIWVEDTGDLRSYVQQTQAKPPGKIKPLPEFKSYEAFIYQGASLRDPFQPLIELVVEDDDLGPVSDLKPDTERAKTYLESFPVDGLNMVGTITSLNGGNLWALLKDPKGEIHRVSNGDFIGLDYGQVQEVSELGLELVEIIENGRGGWMKRPRVIALPEKE